MSLLRSPGQTRGGSQPDLSKFTDDDNATGKTQRICRKRRVPMPDFDMQHEFDSFRNEMRSFFTSFSDIQKETMCKMQQDMTEIKEQLSGIRVSTDQVIEDQNKMKIELDHLKTLCATNENSIKRLQTDVNVSKNSQPSLLQSQTTSFTYEEVLIECQERTQRQHNHYGNT